ncbi:hypothetical protein H4CHR_03006 [Variovorax sp. PBS-H4]|uniref:hypothetical protein n=1 Tax=Variovorax sp. PBS-H4 TaxID=434008 RepID=UPI001317456F|nr:hypothetical protein [Variovorax sp. PBS-H4]VTU32412.1 hypothetical protein H4CHR_03006 [Variovorax sp. PBS-H4]
MMFAAAKVYLVGGVIAALAAAAGVQTLRLAGAHTQLERQRAAAAQLEADRARVALTDALRTSEKMAAFAAAQQGISDALSKETAARVAAERSNGQLSAGLRDAYAAAARRRPEAKASCPDNGDVGDRSQALDGLFAEAGELLARSADLSEEARSIVQRRDSEVKALTGENKALRALMDE